MKPSPTAAGGFTVVEALVALALLAVALLTGLGVYWQQPRIERRLEARRLAVRAVETALEGVRAGAVPLTPGPLGGSSSGGGTGPGAPGGPAPPWADGPGPRPAGPGEPTTPPTSPPLVWLEVTPAGADGLFEVRATAHYSTFGEPRRFAVTTLVWQP